MRVRQVQTLVWLGNVLVLAGAGWVAWGFVQTKKSQAKVEKTEWPESGGKAFETPRWPGDVGGFTHIWSTEVNGLVPKKEEAIVKQPERPLEDQFKEKLQISGGILGSSGTTIINFVFDGKPCTLRYGESIDALGRSWQFTAFTIDITPDEKKERSATARFAAGDLKVAVTQVPQFLKSLTDEEVKKFKATYEPGGSVDPGVVSREKIKCAAYETAAGQWVVTSDEVLWWETFGEAEVLSKLTAKTETDPAGESRGVRLVKVPAPPALGTGRGLRDGDVIRSINGVAMASLKDVTDYLRGDGRCKPRYLVVYERDGAERTVTYDVQRREEKRAASRERSP